jgi:hypothetical protein
LFLPARVPAEFLEHERLEELAKHRAVGRQCMPVPARSGAGDTRVADVQLWCLDQATEPSCVPRRQCLDQEYPLQQREVIVHRRPAHVEWASQLSDVRETTGLAGGQRQQPRERVELTNPGEVADVALDESLDVVVVPDCPSSGSGPGQSRGVAAGRNSLGQLRHQSGVRSPLERAAEDRIEERRWLVGRQLRLRQRMQAHDLHAASERVAETRHEEHVRGTSQKEPPRRPSSVDRSLDRGEHGRNAAPRRGSRGRASRRPRRPGRSLPPPVPRRRRT